MDKIRLHNKYDKQPNTSGDISPLSNDDSDDSDDPDPFRLYQEMVDSQLDGVVYFLVKALVEQRRNRTTFFSMRKGR